MSESSDEEAFKSDFLAAKERDLKPLLEESMASLELNREQARDMERFLTEAWFFGARGGHAQMLARMTPQAEIEPAEVHRVEAEFKALMEESADTLNVTVDETIAMWALLGRAWTAGAHTLQAEIMARFIETKSDVGAEALEWLDEEGESCQ